jgi:hypothetical protein
MKAGLRISIKDYRRAIQGVRQMRAALIVPEDPLVISGCDFDPATRFELENRLPT